MRADGEHRFLFVCNTDRGRSYDDMRFTMQGEWHVTLLDTLTGGQAPLPAHYESGTTMIIRDMPAHGSLLVQLTKGRGEKAQPQPRVRWREMGRLQDPVPITLSEPNVLLLDQAEYQFDDEPWQPQEEILRLDNELRARQGWPLRMDALVQPWATSFPAPSHTLRVRFMIDVDVAVEALQLALEAAADTTIILNGREVTNTITRWWVDEAIQTVALPPLQAGRHELILALPYGPQTNPEWCYLLGDFGVDVRGRHGRITAPVRQLVWSDWTRQGLPFYAGNATYHCELPASDESSVLQTPHFAAPLLTVESQGQRIGAIAFAPFQIELGAGTRTVDITAYGNRVNAFGALHNVDPHIVWYGPDAWRSVGSAWAYEYQLRPMGVLVAPIMSYKTQ